MNITTRFNSMNQLSTWFMLAALVLSALLIPAAPAAAAVTEEWVARYNGPGNYDDTARAMVVDKDGNVYVTGYVLVAIYSCGDFECDDSDYATIKYDANGNQLWVARYNGPDNRDDTALAIALDASGNVYVTGKSQGEGTNYGNYATVKYDPNGNQLWVARYNGPGNVDVATAMVLDKDGNVYVTGYSAGSGTSNYDYATIKYDPNGNQLWVARYNGPGNGYDTARAMAVDKNGNVYVTGKSIGADGVDDYATVKYDPNGNQLWVARYDGPDELNDIATALAVDGSGNIYVTGQSAAGEANSFDTATVKYDPNGNELWVARYNGGGANNGGRAVALDGSGNVYVTGEGVDEYATIKYDPNGNQLWAARYDGPDESEDIALALAVDGDGKVYVTGVSSRYTDPESDEVTSDYATVGYDPNGNQLWVARYNGPGNSSDAALALSLDPSGNVYVAGYSAGSGTGADYATIKYKQVPDVALAAGNLHSCALRAIGSVQCWGDSGYGQLGNGRTRDSSTPVTVSGISTATALGARQYHSCARLTDGRVQCWGRNTSGELGNGSTALFASTPVTVSGINTATAVATGGSHSCALLSTGSVQCWGDNTYGQLGDGSTNDSLYPVSVIGITTAIALGAGTAHTCALLADRTIQCWGYNGSGRLGNGNAVNSALPVPVSNISTATAIAVGNLHSCALLANGNVRCWGNNGSGRLGNGNTVRSPTPIRVSGLSGATAISAGGAHSCARLSDQSMQCWGDNTYGQLGNGSTTDAHTPVPVTGLSTVTAITTGLYHSCAALMDGSVHCWGRNNAGQLGNGTLVNSSVPVPVSGINSAVTPSAAGEQ